MQGVGRPLDTSQLCVPSQHVHLYASNCHVFHFQGVSQSLTPSTICGGKFFRVPAGATRPAAARSFTHVKNRCPWIAHFQTSTVLSAAAAKVRQDQPPKSCCSKCCTLGCEVKTQSTVGLDHSTEGWRV